MLQIPEKGFNRSVNTSNVAINTLGDWIEACSVFDGPYVTRGDVVDLLVEGQICAADNQDLAHEIAESGWSELVRRKKWGGVPNTTLIESHRVTNSASWEDDLIRSFFLLLSLFRIYPEWAKGHYDHVNQGELFEKICEQLCPHLLPGWQTYRAGWSPDNTKDIPAIIEELTSRIYVKGNANLENWLTGDENDGGLDIVCYRSFLDEREAMPLFFLQCASGRNWRDKVQTPNPAYWKTLLDAAVEPSAGVLAPFVIEDLVLRRASLMGQTIVFDRLRLLSAANDGEVILGEELALELLEWMRPRVAALPRAA